MFRKDVRFSMFLSLVFTGFVVLTNHFLDLLIIFNDVRNIFSEIAKDKFF